MIDYSRFGKNFYYKGVLGDQIYKEPWMNFIICRKKYHIFIIVISDNCARLHTEYAESQEDYKKIYYD